MTVVEQIKARLILSNVINSYLKLQPKGHGLYNALCPFHSEKTPSFYVNDHKGFFHCFGCGAHGDVLTFVMEYEGLSFYDVLQKFGLALGLDVHKQAPENPLYGFIKKVSDYFVDNLHNNASALDYVQNQRKIPPNIIERFEIGYCDDRSLLYIFFDDKEKLIELGLIKGNYNIFQNRIIFPIKDRYNRIVGFGGRLIKGEGPKYLNSKQSAIFHKKEELYGFDKENRIAATKTNRLVVTEGYFDVLALAKIGVAAVAPMGTALDVQHIIKAWEFVKSPILFLDNDLAGHNALHRVLKQVMPYITPSTYLQIARSNDVKDPDELVNKYQCNEVVDILNNATTLSTYIFDSTLARYNTFIPEQRAACKKELEQIAASISDKDTARSYRSVLLNMFFESYGKKKTSHKIQALPTLQYSNQYLFLMLMFKFKELRDDNTLIEMLLYLELNEEENRIRNMILNHEIGAMPIPNILNVITTVEMAKEEIFHLMQGLQRKYLQQEIAQLKQHILNTPDDESALKRYASLLDYYNKQY